MPQIIYFCWNSSINICLLNPNSNSREVPKWPRCCRSMEMFLLRPRAGGLGLELHYEDGRAFCEFLAPEKFQGYQGMLHGGIVTGILDEVMWWTLFVRTRAVSAAWKIEVEFRRPVRCGTDIRRGQSYGTGLQKLTVFIPRLLIWRTGYAPGERVSFLEQKASSWRM